MLLYVATVLVATVLVAILLPPKFCLNLSHKCAQRLSRFFLKAYVNDTDFHELIIINVDHIIMLYRFQFYVQPKAIKIASLYHLFESGNFFFFHLKMSHLNRESKTLCSSLLLAVILKDIVL